MAKWPGGIIRKTPVTPSGGSASGVWTMAEVAYWKKQGLWPTLPGAPTIGTATAGASSASVTFTAPTNTGTPSTISTYRVTSSPGAITATGSSSPITVTGLTNGTSYTFTVAANNGAGYGPESASSNAVTPVEPNYMAVLKSGSISLYNTGGDVDSSGNLYSVGFADTASDDPVVLTKYDASGALLFQYAYTRSGYNFNQSKCAVSSSGDIYIWASDGSTGVIFKLNSSGVVQWSYQLSISIGGIGPVYISGSTIYTGAYTSTGALLCSFGAAGTFNWARRFSSSSQAGGVEGIVVSPSGYLYAGAYTNSGGGSTSATMVRLDTSGNNVWIRTIAAGGRDYIQSIATDASDNLYAAFYYSSNPGYTRICVFDSNYNGIRQASTSSSSNYPYLNNMQVDSSGNVYAYASQNYLFKFNSSMSLQFQRQVSGASQSFQYGFMKPFNNRIYVNANNYNSPSSRYNFFAMKVPDDGTSTGTYSVDGVNYSYASSTTYSWSTSGTPSTASGPTQSTVSGSLSSVTITRSTPTYTQTVTTF